MNTLSPIWVPAKCFRQNRLGVRAIILHSSDGHKEGDIATLTGESSGVSSHFYVTKSGELYQFVKLGDTAYHAGIVDQIIHGNSCTIGIEQEHIDGGEEWSPLLLQTTANLIAALRQKYGPIPALSHASVARPVGRKQDPKDFQWGTLHSLVDTASTTKWTLLAK